MSLATYNDLIVSLASWATRSDLSAQMPDFVAWADQEIGRRLRAQVMLTTAPLSLTGETVSAPADFLAIKRMYLDVTPRVRLGVVDAGVAMDMTTEQGTAAYPLAVAVEGSTFRFAPLFSSSGTVQLLYYAKPVALTASNQTNVVLAKYPFLYLYGALEALYSYLEDTDNEQKFGGKFGALIEDINTREARDVLSGPLAVPMPSGGVA
jgi:hypothetical protein